jgi:hypothetical protein
MGEEKWNEHMGHCVFQKIKYRRYVSGTEKEWLGQNRDKFDSIMQQHIARRKQDDLALWESQKI